MQSDGRWLTTRRALNAPLVMRRAGATRGRRELSRVCFGGLGQAGNQAHSTQCVCTT